MCLFKNLSEDFFHYTNSSLPKKKKKIENVGIVEPVP